MIDEVIKRLTDEFCTKHFRLVLHDEVSAKRLSMQWIDENSTKSTYSFISSLSNMFDVKAAIGAIDVIFLFHKAEEWLDEEEDKMSLKNVLNSLTDEFCATRFLLWLFDSKVQETTRNWISDFSEPLTVYLVCLSKRYGVEAVFGALSIVFLLQQATEYLETPQFQIIMPPDDRSN